MTPPWRSEDAARFAAARLIFRDLTQRAVTSSDKHAELTRAATVLGEALFAVLFEDDARRHLERAEGFLEALSAQHADPPPARPSGASRAAPGGR